MFLLYFLHLFQTLHKPLRQTETHLMHVLGHAAACRSPVNTLLCITKWFKRSCNTCNAVQAVRQTCAQLHGQTDAYTEEHAET